MAARFLVGGGDGNWTSTTNWSATSGGASGASAPVAADDVTFDLNSGTTNITTDTSGRACLSLTVTAGYTGTLTMTNTLTVGAGNITLGANMVFAGAAALIKSTAGTFTSNGKTVSIPVTLNGNVVYTFADNWDIDGTFTVGLGTTTTLNGSTISIGGSFTTAGITLTGTSNLLFDGTGTWSGTAAVSNTGTKVINTAGTLTFSGIVIVGVALTYTAGTVVTTGSTLSIANTATTLDISGITLNNFGSSTITNNSTTTLSSDVNVGDDFLIRTSTTGTINGNQINVAGSLVGASHTGILTGTTEIVFNGTGSISWSTGSVRNPITINTAGTVTLTGDLRYNTGTFTYTAGTVLGSAAVFMFTVNSVTTTFDLNGLALDASFSNTALNAIIQFASDVIFVAGNSIVSIGATGANLNTLRSNSGGVQRGFTVQAGVSIDIGYTNITDLDNSPGALVGVFKGTISNSLNFVQMTPYNAPYNNVGTGDVRSYVG